MTRFVQSDESDDEFFTGDNNPENPDKKRKVGALEEDDSMQPRHGSRATRYGGGVGR